MAHIGEEFALKPGHLFGLVFGNAQLVVGRLQIGRAPGYLRFELHAAALLLQIAPGKAGVFVFQQAVGDGAAHVLSDEGDGGDFAFRVVVPFAMVDVDDADGSAFVDERNRQKRLVGVFHQGGKGLETRIG